MKKNGNQRLCGGTFFTLLLQARKPRMGVREHYLGNSDGLSEPKTLIALAKVVVPDMQDPLKSMIRTIKGNAFDFKTCKSAGGTYFPFGDTDARKTFDTRVKTEYRTTLAAMSEFVDGFIDAGGSTKKDEHLVGALVELISIDDSIEDEQLFYIGMDGTTIPKSCLIEDTEFCLQSFLLGVWHFAVLRKEGNTIGEETYNAWCPTQGGGKRTYTATLGDNQKRPIQLSYHTVDNPEIPAGAEYLEPRTDSSADNDIVEPVVEHGVQQTQVLQQSVNNPFIFNFAQNGNGNTQIGNIENYYSNKNR
jgi:hypothetical protein